LSTQFLRVDRLVIWASALPGPGSERRLAYDRS
jgi:hypothetical protein